MFGTVLGPEANGRIATTSTSTMERKGAASATED
jgi:hypothetical protein